MVLITSAAYISPGLASEFGNLPPAMLPVQSARLYSHQLKLFEDEEKVFLSLPKSYEIEWSDVEELKQKGVEIIRVPDNITLGHSVIYCLNIVGDYDSPLRILHGDTLFESLSNEIDIYAVARREDDYKWANVNNGEIESLVYAGYFSFSSPRQLIRSIAESDYDFMNGIESYSKSIPMKKWITDTWKDFGLVNSYYRSVSKMTTERAFNSLEATKYSITKYSKDSFKIFSEAHWFKNMPIKLRHYVPVVWEEGIDEGGRGFYTIEYYYLSSLSNLFVFGGNSIYTWYEVLEACKGFLNDLTKYQPNNKEDIAKSNDLLFASKTRSRLLNYCIENDVDMNKPFLINGEHVPSLSYIIDDLEKHIKYNAEEFVNIMHGDFCFSNILYDFKTKSIKVLDPRGCDANGNESEYGDLRYDVAKLAHSILGLYDFIIGGRYQYKEHDRYNLTLRFGISREIHLLQKRFMESKFGGYDLTSLSTYPIMIFLFLSMLPLHSDRPDRQKAMLANALRLYHIFKKL